MNSTETAPKRVSTAYALRLAERREVEQIRQLTNFGLTLGWLFSLLGGFCWLCVISRLDWLWSGMFVAGLLLLVFGCVLPQALDRPHRIWMGLAHLQGRLVMTALLTIVYFTLMWPLGLWERRRRGNTHPFYEWDKTPPVLPSSGWEPLSPGEASAVAIAPKSSRRRSLVRMFAETLSFFAERGHYFLLPVLLLLLLLGLILFFVQSSVLAPFIYTIG